MKKVLLVILLSFAIVFFTPDIKKNVSNVSDFNKLDYNYYTNRNYDFVYYSAGNYKVKNQDDIKKVIFNGLNEGKDSITFYCSYDKDDCISDFNSVYRNKSLMSSINDYVSPYNQYSSTRSVININNGVVKITVDIEKKFTENQINEIDKFLDGYLNELPLDEMNDMDKIKWTHDFLINKNKYDNSSEDSYSAYGAIVGDKAVCQGYAEAAAIILDRFNIPNIMISSDTHVWNLIYINGEWLHLDVTWDDPILSNGEDSIIYDYYLVNSEQLSLLDNSDSHKFDSNYYLEVK